MNVKSNSFTFGAALLLALAPFAAQAQDMPSNLKGSGEVVITSGGGTWEAAQKKAFFDPFTRDTGIKVVLVPEDHAKLLASVKLGQPEADITSVPGGALAGFVNKGAVEKMDYSLFGKETLAAIPEQMKNENGVGALLYSIAIAYNTTKFPGDRCSCRRAGPERNRFYRRHGSRN
ncbi:extracellular solute-binding protein [Phyllobacterium endophyticum]|uniref:extracellular solute-binding protein n=1 Tax=Phyllobacterium endophyticum TaxID=1149773 RepID=UPI001FEEE1CC|nr:extracellular solute-binding protein [Phyllobacterium endophyticum]